MAREWIFTLALLLVLVACAAVLGWYLYSVKGV